MKEKITREPFFSLLSPQKARQHIVDHENGLVSFPYEALVLTLTGNPITANKKHSIKDYVFFRGIRLNCRSKAWQHYSDILKCRLNPCHNTVTTMWTGRSTATAAGCRGWDVWQSSGHEAAWGPHITETQERTVRESGYKEVEDGGTMERLCDSVVRRERRHTGTKQVPWPTLMSRHYPMNTATHVVSDQLGRHKGKTLELSWGLRLSAGYI